MSVSRRTTQSIDTNHSPVNKQVPVGGLVTALLATLFWSTSALMIDRLSTIYRLTALEMSTWRVAIATVVVAMCIAAYRPRAFHLDSEDLPYYVVSGVLGIALAYVTWAVSIQINKPAVGAALSFSAPAFVAIGDRLFLGSRLQAVQIGAIVVNLLGCGLAAGIHSPAELVHTPTGLLVGLGNGLAFSLYTLMSRASARTGNRDPLTVLFAMFVFGGLALLAVGIPREGAKLVLLHLDPIGWALLFGLALGPTLGAYALFNSSLKTLPATLAVLTTTLEPPLVALLAYLILGRSVKGLQWVGIGLIVAGVLVMQLGIRLLYRLRDRSTKPAAAAAEDDHRNVV
jgi:drug/metabolite transporter, DME family